MSKSSSQDLNSIPMMTMSSLSTNKSMKYSNALFGSLIGVASLNFLMSQLVPMSQIQDGDVWLELDKCCLHKLLNIIEGSPTRIKLRTSSPSSTMLIKNNPFQFKILQELLEQSMVLNLVTGIIPLKFPSFSHNSMKSIQLKK